MEKMNKKAAIPVMLIVLIVGAILAVLLGLGILFSNTLRLYAIGTAIIIVTLIYGLSSEINKQKSGVMIIGIIIGAGFILVPALGLMQTAAPSGTYIQAPTFYYYECSPASQPIESTHVTLTTGSSNGWITCPSNTDTCDLIVLQTETTKWYSTDRRLVYQVCHASGVCETPITSNSPQWLPWEKATAPSVRINNLITGDKVWLNYQALNLLFQWKDQPNGAEWLQQYKPFILWKVDMFGGGRTEYTTVSQGCRFPSNAIPNLIDSVTNSAKQINTQSSTDDTILPFYKTRNFIGAYVPLSTANVNFVTYNGQQGYCLNRQIFSIMTVTTNGQTYQVVDANFNTRLASSVTCCPGETQPNQKCGDNFQWQTITQSQCSAFKPCAGADWMPSSSKTLIRYNCVSGFCVPETKAVSCTSNLDCANNQICDTKLYTCIDAGTGKVIPNGTVIGGDEPECKWFENYVVKETVTYNWYDVFKLNPKPNIDSGCRTSNGIIITGIVIIIVTAISVLIIYYFPKKKPRSTKRRKK